MRRHTSAIRALVFSAVWLCAPAAVYACPICFQIEDGPVVNGVRAAVGVLVGVTSVVLVGFAVFATRVARRQ